MIASRPNTVIFARLRFATRGAEGPSRRAGGVFLGALVIAIVGCASTAPLPVGRPLEALPHLSAPLPDEADRAARDIAAALWRSDADAAARAAEILERIDAARAQTQTPRTGLAAYARDAETALLPAGPPRRAAQARLLEREDLPADLATRLEQDVADDPLKLAKKRLREDRLTRWGGAANEVSEGVGGSLATPVLLPVRLAQTMMRVALHLHEEEELSARGRQALRHWQDFVEQNPDAPQAAELLEKIEHAQLRWQEMQVERAREQAKAALAEGEPILAAFLAERALRYRSEDADALALLQEASTAGRTWNENRARTLTVADAIAPLTDAEWVLARALLTPGSDLIASAQPLLGAASGGAAEGQTPPRAAEAAQFALALAAREAGRETESWEQLEEIARGEGSLARHAAAMLRDFDANPYRAFRFARSEKTKQSAREVLFGPLAYGAREHDLPRPIEWLVEVPTLTSVVLGLPSRLLAFPYGRSEKRGAAALARRYLERTPEGAHAEEVREWLREYEDARDNAVAALALAEGSRDVDDEERAELRERAAEQIVAAAGRERTRAGRVQLLARAAELYPDSEAAKAARESVRREIQRASPQRIRVSRQYLTENPALAGPQGFALQPGLLDEKFSNGELHKDGLNLIGGRWIELAYVGEAGKDGEPERRAIEVSSEHLARIVAMLEESAMRRTRVDRDATFAQDASRETFFERARLGLADEDPRGGGSSEYAFEGMREMYGLVRGRESILPVELVLQSGLEDFGFGAFPRIRLPRETADQILYR